MTGGVNSIKIDSVNKFAISITAIITERDIKSEYLFRMCCVATNLVRSLEIGPVRRATLLYQLGRTRNRYGATHFILVSSTAESSATGGYVVIRERIGQNEEPAPRNEGRTTKRPSFVPSSRFDRCNM